LSSWTKTCKAFRGLGLGFAAVRAVRILGLGGGFVFAGGHCFLHRRGAAFGQGGFDDRCHAFDLVFAHVRVHVLPAGKHRSLGGLGVQGVAVFDAAQRVAAGAADGLGIGFALEHLGVGVDTGYFTSHHEQGGQGKQGGAGWCHKFIIGTQCQT
jgi:hypothetical protein